MGPRVVLVEPQNAANVGFVARVLANFGLCDWALVRGVEWRGSEAERTGAMARERLEAARRVDSLEQAAAGCTHLVGFSARPGRHRRLLALPALRAEVEPWGPEARPALIFGREDRGLDAAETERCSLLVTIPAAELASFNLSHAVAVALYEWFRGSAAPPPAAQGVSWAPAKERERLAARTRAELEAASFPGTGELEGTLRRLAARPMEARDLRVLEKVLRHAQYLRERHG
ncbi:MAG: hypothetical protein EYC70_01110 [Planctomycetota bacterium]|nr:MAG: hypothetical protein EYC70_01110 [Planctomycetota bacterium]